MRAFYYLFILFNNLLSIHIHKYGEKFGGLAPPNPLMSAAYALYKTIEIDIDIDGNVRALNTALCCVVAQRYRALDLRFTGRGFNLRPVAFT